MLATPLVYDAMRRLTDRRGIFHSEADFQHALAWQLHEMLGSGADVRLHVRQPGLEPAVVLDIAVGWEGQRIAIEVKYFTKRLELVDGRGERFSLKDHAAPDFARYGFCRDLERLERVVDAGLADAGAAVMLTNDPALWTERATTAADRAFRLHERVLSGSLAWASRATGTADHPALALRGSYYLTWHPFRDPETVWPLAASSFQRHFLPRSA